jgi:hypothetical protein
VSLTIPRQGNTYRQQLCLFVCKSDKAGQHSGKNNKLDVLQIVFVLETPALEYRHSLSIVRSACDTWWTATGL